MQADLPENQEQFKLNEVCKLANVQPYMLRFWGTEFPQLEAQKSGTGQRLYGRDQVELILEIRRLLFDEGLTIAGARKRIDSGGEQQREKPAAPPKKKRTKAKAKPAVTTEEKVEPPAPDPAVIAQEVDKKVEKRVQPLLATLAKARKELAAIVDEMKGA